MKRGITSKDITLALGILVALILALTVFLNESNSKDEASVSVLKPLSFNVTKDVIYAAEKILF